MNKKERKTPVSLPAEPEQVHAEPIREELVGRQVVKSPHLKKKREKEKTNAIKSIN